MSDNAEYSRVGQQQQPPPKRNDKPAVWDLVIEDICARDAVGRERYGTPLQPFNGRSALIDLYQELLDAVVYVRQKIEEDGMRHEGVRLLIEAAEDFVQKVENGEARSVRSYAKFKSALAQFGL